MDTPSTSREQLARAAADFASLSPNSHTARKQNEPLVNRPIVSSKTVKTANRILNGDARAKYEQTRDVVAGGLESNTSFHSIRIDLVLSRQQATSKNQTLRGMFVLYCLVVNLVRCGVIELHYEIAKRIPIHEPFCLEGLFFKGNDGLERRNSDKRSTDTKHVSHRSDNYLYESSGVYGQGALVKINMTGDEVRAT
jgi:hypothetical protein